MRLNHAALDRLRAEYARIESQPPKTSIELGHDRFLHALPASLSDGTAGCKTIWIDEASGASESIVMVVRPDGESYTMNGTTVTSLRCGLMAVFCAEQLFPLGSMLRLGVVGYGRIGGAVERVMREFYDLDSCEVVLSPREDPYRRLDILADCDIVVTCASVRRQDTPLVFDAAARTRAYIAFDSGFTLGPSFRALQSRCDYPRQMTAHWTDEFPHDGPEPPALGLITDPTVRPGPVVFYSYGIGIADLIVAEHLW
jgi:hypothetical protein